MRGILCCYTNNPAFFSFYTSWEPIIKYVKDQHSAYLRKELTAQREKVIQDNRVHCCLYFIAPSGHS